MRLDVVTIFPEYLAPLRLSLVGKSIEKGLLGLGVHDLRQWTTDRHRTVDDTPYGGGAGMVMKPQPWGAAIDAVVAGSDDPRLIVLTPSGRRFDQQLAHELAAERHLIFTCGRYEGIDARVVEDAATRMRVDEVSIGDYVLNGGEAAALVIIEAVVRLIPGVIGNPESLAEESHALEHDQLLEYPVYTKPPTWRGLDVPQELFSGHHAQIAAWRREQALARTRARRPDLLPGSPAELVIGPACTSDAGELFALQQAAFLPEGLLNGSLGIPPLTETLAALRQVLDEGVVLTARRNGRLVGSVRGQSDDDGSWYIGRLMVAPDLQGQGIGRRLLDAIEAKAPPGTSHCRLVTGALSASNIAFYAGRGYLETEADVDPDGVAIVRMAKPLR
jgi:tRNA (guanine37-N1)-methyltransferase